MVSAVGALVPYALSAATRNWYSVSGLSPVNSAQVFGVVRALTQGPETPSRFSTTYEVTALPPSVAGGNQESFTVSSVASSTSMLRGCSGGPKVERRESVVTLDIDSTQSEFAGYMKL